MFRSLRQRLIWSQIIPLLIVLPLMGALLISSLEGQILIPELAKNLVSNARLLAEISSAEYELWGDPILFEQLIGRVQLDPSIQVMFLDGNGRLLYSSDPNDLAQKGKALDLPGLPKALAGHEAAITNYSILHFNNAIVDIYEPVSSASREVIGIVRLTYTLGSLLDIFNQLRWQILIALAFGLLLSALLGTWLAISISRPVGEVTSAIYALATGKRREAVQERGPEELRSQARAVNYLVEQLHSLESSRRQLLANITHELGRPLGALRSAIHALGQGAAKDPELLADLTRGMDEETFRLEYLLDELANLYDKSTGSLELNLTTVEPGAWLRGVMIPWRAAAQEKQLEWLVEIPDALPSISMDAVRMAQVIGNLLSNAIKYTAAGGQVKISAGADDLLPALPGPRDDVSKSRVIWFRVSDSGAGIQADERSKIFIPFFRGEPGRRIKQGMGLGLTIAKDLVTAHGGELAVESVPGQGSSFTVTLPLEPD